MRREKEDGSRDNGGKHRGEITLADRERQTCTKEKTEGRTQETQKGHKRVWKHKTKQDTKP